MAGSTRTASSPFLSAAAIVEMVTLSDADPYQKCKRKSSTESSFKAPTVLMPPVTLPAPVAFRAPSEPSGHKLLALLRQMQGDVQGHQLANNNILVDTGKFLSATGGGLIVVPVLRQVEALNASRPADPQPCYYRFKALRLQDLMFSHGIRRCAPVISKNRGAGGFEHEPLLRTKSPGREAKQPQLIPPPAPTSAPSTAPYLMPISDLMTLRAPHLPLTLTSAPRSKRQLEEDLCESLRRSFTWVRTT